MYDRATRKMLVKIDGIKGTQANARFGIELMIIGGRFCNDWGLVSTSFNP